MALLEGSGRNASINNFFTGVSLAKMLLQPQLTVDGAMKKCKRQFPKCTKAAKPRLTKTSVFGFNDHMMMVSYDPKKDKAGILLSTMHDNKH